MLKLDTFYMVPDRNHDTMADHPLFAFPLAGQKTIQLVARAALLPLTD
jgi:hypothetical protein